MIVKELKNNTYECGNGEKVYAPNQETAIKRCKENRKRTVIGLLITMKGIAFNKGYKGIEDITDDVMHIVKDMN